MPAPIKKHAILLLGLTLTTALVVAAEEPAGGDEVVKMEPFNVTAYHGKIPIIDGFTGKDYTGDNDVVFNFAQSFNKLLLGYHKKLVLDEIKHLQFRIKLGKEFEREMGKLTAAFGFGEFTLDNSKWLRRERAIITRLIREPFFKIKSLVAWDLDRLNKMAPKKPDSKYASDIRFNPETGRWERRVTTRWDVNFFNNRNRRGKWGNAFATDKTQGLNLDTHKGFHYIERGLPVDVPSTAFQEVKLTYPIFYSDNQAGEKELRYLQETFIANLYFIYDPFSWMARRDTRFRGGFSPDCLEHVQAQRIYVDDRDWFDVVLSRFLSDVITIKLQGAEEIYSLHMLSKRLSECPRALGVGLDLLNWNKGEKREAIDKPEAEARISPTSPGGFRYVMIDAHQRLGEPFIEKIRSRLLAQKEIRRPINGRAMLTQLIEELSGMPYDEFARRAEITQETYLAQHKINRPTPQPPAAANSGKD
ncbi:MAG: hypothetical protein Q7S40_29905 [Opitutaceae bacterium]|nr:hypothetical protein [Opitutaceae bacterium]